ncbi:YciI family protein [Nocardioides sp.]|uniref:YciI family protein n=1 Tax=Nocardioides sp. TaxID=35761 RepID=UPI0027175E56|nr:YciI family protein [Nocardioides sp.]MDO9456246.1 YciI family protein [Nocardioides sp.]
MPQYFLAVNHDEASDAEMATKTMEDFQPIIEAVDAFNTALRESGAWVFAGGLQDRESSTVVDATGDSPIVTDGPFSESKEYLGGFWIIEAADLDAALDWATKGSQACAGKVEVRPFQLEPEA